MQFPPYVLRNPPLARDRVLPLVLRAWAMREKKKLHEATQRRHVGVPSPDVLCVVTCARRAELGREAKQLWWWEKVVGGCG